MTISTARLAEKLGPRYEYDDSFGSAVFWSYQRMQYHYNYMGDNGLSIAVNLQDCGSIRIVAPEYFSVYATYATDPYFLYDETLDPHLIEIEEYFQKLNEGKDVFYIDFSPIWEFDRFRLEPQARYLVIDEDFIENSLLNTIESFRRRLDLLHPVFAQWFKEKKAQPFDLGLMPEEE